MAVLFPINNLYTLLGFYSGAATVITDDRGIYILDELKILHDNYCESLCTSIFLPGGTIVGQGGVNIPNPGITVSL